MIPPVVFIAVGGLWLLLVLLVLSCCAAAGRADRLIERMWDDER
jgi:hypothetical protein